MAYSEPKQSISKNLIIIGAVLLAIIAAVIAYGYSASQKNKQMAEKAAAYTAQKEAKAKAEADQAAERKRKFDNQQRAWGVKSEVAGNNQPIGGVVSPSPSKRSNPELSEIKLQRLVRGWVEAKLKDAPSAEFRNQKGQCGEVNAKNSYGGYTGFTRFIAASENMIVQEADMAAGDFDLVWAQHCN